ncbi:hypothetical protein [Streptomyces sp. NPDC091219]|uniref:hypothetical protein n=1 Tax=Streptomyces sp. NPDC091219 TaxID=3155193 RepID=UPI00344DB623
MGPSTSPLEELTGDGLCDVPELPVTLDMLGKIADYLRSTELQAAERAALDQGTAVRRGQDPLAAPA